MKLEQKHTRDESDNLNCKIVLVGDCRCGKTALIQRFVNNKFPELYIPTGFEMHTIKYMINLYQLNLAIWDTSGLATYDTVRPLAYANADLFLLCFDLGDRKSLNNVVTKWSIEIQKHCPQTPTILCGCKSDRRTQTYSTLCTNEEKISIEQSVSSEEALEVSRKIGAITYLETSSLQNDLSAKETFRICALSANGKLNNNNNNSSNHANNNSGNLRKSSSLGALNKCRASMKIRKCKSKADFKAENKKCTIM
ncbi:Rho-related GTP-binding protein RhoE-like protein [Dinothrombium tinctorium]|uniref:Rho-related GTP-binding protein RhoE-like protein n=1 Tax=Dinothrombium tinctorium TaxID=1965070 RepID=A0A443QL10_9ACAR|nr:Rho-related GTP-binding protein RhoE-like protein [Dinothrombium tinctorium]